MPGIDGEGDARLRERLEFLAAAAEHEWIAALQPHHAAPAAACSISSSLIASCGVPPPPAALPTQIRSASRRA